MMHKRVILPLKTVHFARGLPLLLPLLLSACAAALPEYEWRDMATARRDLAARSLAVISASGSGTMTLEPARGESLQVDFAFALMMPDQLRIRSWKFNRAVADWTLLPQGAWVWLEGDDGQTRKLREFWSSPQAAVWPLLFGLLPVDAADRLHEVDAARFAIHRQMGEDRLIVLVRKRDLVIEECRLQSREGVTTSVIRMERHRLVDGLPWPMKVTAGAAGASFTLAVTEVTLNEAPAAAAFRPPARAVKIR